MMRKQIEIGKLQVGEKLFLRPPLVTEEGQLIEFTLQEKKRIDASNSSYFLVDSNGSWSGPLPDSTVVDQQIEERVELS